MKNPQFLPNQANILPSEFIHWTDILTKFHNNWTKIVDFFLDLVTVWVSEMLFLFIDIVGILLPPTFS